MMSLPCCITVSLNVFMQCNLNAFTHFTTYTYVFIPKKEMLSHFLYTSLQQTHLMLSVNAITDIDRRTISLYI